MADVNNKSGEPGGRLGTQQMEMILRRLESLPTLPAIATRLLELTVSNRAGIDEVVRLIRADQSITAKLLSLANRADRGLRGQACTIDKVVLMLGFDAVRSAVLSIKVFEMFGPRAAQGPGLQRIEFWKHCLAVASAAELLARHSRRPEDPEEVFVCGLLHDIGKLALEYCLPKSYARVVDAADAHRGNIADFERRVIGMDHTVIGRRLAQLWRLPSAVEHTIWLHHQPVEALPEVLPARKIIALVQLADAIVREQRFGYSGNYTFLYSAAELAERIGVHAAVLQQVVEQLPGTIEQRAAMLGLAEMTSESLYRTALAGANDELGRLNEALHTRSTALSAQAAAFGMLRDFGARLHSQLSLADLCEVMSEAWARLGNLTPSPDRPVAAYAVASGDRTAVVAVRTAPETVRTILLPCRAGFPPHEAPAPGTPAGAAMALVTDEPGRLADTVNHAELLHRALVCGGRWIGGLLWTAQAGSTELLAPAGEALAVAMGFAADALDARDSANVLAEQLGQATQRLYSMQHELAESRALAAVGEMAAGAAHEINNPLAVVVGRAELMAETAAAQDRQTWQTIAQQAQRISDIVTEMMEFARPVPPSPEPTPAGELIERARRLLNGTPLARELDVEVDVAANTPPALVDPRQLAAVLAELMRNAAAACAERPRVRIEAEPDEVGDQVLLRVVDEGCGMDAATAQKAFTPFFSAKPAGRARGMGLSKARRLVQLAGGRIWLQSRPGEGTTVFLLLPRAEAEQDAGQHAVTEPEHPEPAEGATS